MGTITTTSFANPFRYPGDQMVVKQVDLARWITLVPLSTANQYALWKSTDGGSSWAQYSSLTRANIVDDGEIFTDNQGWIYWVYRTSESINGVASDGVYVRRLETGPSNKPDTGEVLVAAAANGGAPGASLTGVAVTSHFNSSTGYHYIVCAVGTTRGGAQGVSLVGAQIDPTGTITATNARLSGTREWLYTETAGRVGVSVDKEHSGDGYSASNPNLWVTFGRQNLYVVKVAWNGNGWSGSPGATLIASGLSARDYLPGLWDGNRFLMTVPDAATPTTVKVFERNRSNTATAVRQSPAHPQGTIRQAVTAYDTATGNFRVFAVGTSNAVLYTVDYVRATNLWGSWTVVAGSPAPVGTAAENWGAKPSTYQDASYGLYYATGVSPFTLTYTPQSQSYPPNIPTWVSPGNGAAQNVAAGLTLDWDFSDPDPNDTQSAYALSRQIGAGAVQYYTAAGGTWGATEVFNTSTTSAATLAAAWGLDADANHTYKVKVKDAAGNSAVAYSAGLVVIPSAQVNPAITAPTAAQVIGTDHVTLTWTATQQTQYRIRLAVQGGAQVYDSGWVTDSATRSVVVPYTLPNSTAWTVTLNTANLEGLASADQTRNFTVSYTPPATPTLVASPLPAAGVIRVAITNPTPGGGQPAVSTQELWHRQVGTTAATRIASGLASGATVDDFWAVSGISYEFQAVVTGVNGTTATSAWTA